MALASVNVYALGGGGGGVIYLSTPEQTGSLTYNGSEQSPAWLNYSSEQMLIGGTTSATDAGTYTTTFTPQGLCAWLDGTSNTKQVTWTIAKAAINLSASISGSVTYNSTGTITVSGNAGSGTITATSSNTSYVTVQSKTTSSVTVKCVGVSSTAATITISVPETTNYLAGSTTCAVSTAKAAGSITLSKTSGTVTYGTPFTFTVTNNTSGGTLSVSSASTTYATASISGTTVTVNCVQYRSATTAITVTSAATANYNAATATFTMTAAKASCTLTLSSTSGTVEENGTKTFTVTTPSDGTLSVSSSNTSVATASISSKTVTVTGKSYGTATITVSQAAGTNHTAPTSKTYSATVTIIVASTLNETDWATISDVSKAGIGDTHWDIGDCKEVTLNGSIGTLSLSNQTLCVFILHFNYAMNGTAENNIIWGGFKSALTNGKDYALCSSNYGAYPEDGTKCFNMNHWGNVNYGGWKGCDLRYDILGATSTQPSDYGKKHTTSCVGYDATAATLTSPKSGTLLAALPSDFRNALRLWTRWVDAVGNTSNVEANIKSTVDAVTLLTEWEVQGARTYANEYEKNHQTQMAYYKNGNSKIKYRHDSTSSTVDWWCASPVYAEYFRFCYVSTDGSANAYDAKRSYGVAPAFKT